MDYEKLINDNAAKFYNEKQKEWVKDNEIIVGSVVRVNSLRKPEGFHYGTVHKMDLNIDELLIVRGIATGGILLNDDCYYPFTCLKKVVEKDTKLIVEMSRGTIYVYRETESHFNINEENDRKDKTKVHCGIVDEECCMNRSLKDNHYIVFDLKV